MEFNVNASEAGARLRTGVGTHTLSIGDHDVTLMISGSRVELMTLAIAIAAETGLKIQLDGYIDGNAAFKTLHEQFRIQREELENEQLADQIQDKANALIPEDSWKVIGPSLRRSNIGFRASIAVKPEGKRNRYVEADGATIREALQQLDLVVSEL